ncbi:hypothetical protein O3G_MSEX006971 [Manduca sexta]|uniref:Kinase n=1 Tax=Manduca sexta TaxID=7130 RepID=A0A922CM94_MANSE|nr:hypothetical protein O3G_MSEX006971 [Manduca sexta]KAG6451115.1 hypothetical protein O3G_MSEX006971 [Manduca sexta]KAG6451116.1 hypothetical protein O3G_MSEX006971 [Manduca sexta]KAG6451117.1 hypothetical protein O3G_MSEX006971 [Manduca sexta]
MSNGTERRGGCVRRQRSIHHVHYDLRRRDEDMAKPLVLPTCSLQVYDTQVAGHKSVEDTKYLGLLQCNNGTILKPILKESQRREVDFYNRLYSSTDPELVELRRIAPKYYGCKRFTYNGHEQEYIILEDLTQRMLEPCVMDVKIGKRTWDPLATEEKKKNEQTKYALCKQEYGFCIPGFQVYKLATGKLHRYNKDYGKKLHGQAVKDAIRTFLNGGSGAGLCRALVLQLVSRLWRVQRWARGVRVRLYSASLLLAYDAAKLRACCVAAPAPTHAPTHALLPMNCRSAPITRRKSIHSTHSPSTGSNFSGQITSKGPHYKKVNSVPITSMTLAQNSFAPPPPINSPWSEALERLNHNHSFEHNYEDKLSKIKMNYRALLDQLSYDSPNPKPWGTVAIIDFAHAFFNDDDDEKSVDENFKEGIDNFVEILEDFLRETDDQVI